MVSGFISFVVQVPVFFLQVELDPVVKTNDFCSRFCFSNKDMFKSTGVQAEECCSHHRNKILLRNCYIILYLTVVMDKLLHTHTHTYDHLLVLVISPCVSLSVVKVKPDQLQLALKLPQVRAGLPFANKVLMSPLWRNHIHDTHINAKRM